MSRGTRSEAIPILAHAVRTLRAPGSGGQYRLHGTSGTRSQSGRHETPSWENSFYPLRPFLRHFFGSFVVRRAPSCADHARRKVFLQSRLSGTEGRFAKQDGTPSEMTLDHFVMVRIHAKQVGDGECITEVFTLYIGTLPSPPLRDFVMPAIAETSGERALLDSVMNQPGFRRLGKFPSRNPGRRPLFGLRPQELIATYAVHLARFPRENPKAATKLTPVCTLVEPVPVAKGSLISARRFRPNGGSPSAVVHRLSRAF